MNKKAKNRGWVKNVAIIFLAALAVLTFFSNTILNRSLAEVSGVTAYGGEISTALRITGTVESADAYYATLPGTTPRQIKSILVRAGDTVEAGQAIFELEPLDNDSEAVRNAEKALQSARDAYQRELNSHAGSDFETQVTIEDLQITLNDLVGKQRLLSNSIATLESLRKTLDNAKATADLRADELADINQQITDFGSGSAYTVDERLKLEALNDTVSKNETALAQARIDLQYALSYDPAPPPGFQTVNEAQQAVANCELALKESEFARDEYKKTLENKYAKTLENLETAKRDKTREKTDADRAVETATKNLVNLQIDVGMLPIGTTTPSTTTLDQAVKDAAKAVRDAEIALEKVKINSNASNADRNLTLRSLQQAIDDAKFALDKLVGDSGAQSNVVTTRYGGMVLSIMSDIYVGKEVYPEAQLAQIEINGKGFTITQSVTNAQAQRVRIGDIGQISSWGMNNTILTLAAIKTDPQAPSTNKLLEFDIQGDVITGQNLEFTIGTRSQYYDMIVPNAAIRPSQDGKMVLVAVAKQTPLGTRYIATPVEVEVLDSDATNSAIRGDLGWGPFVITTSNKPIEANSQVRLAG